MLTVVVVVRIRSVVLVFVVLLLIVVSLFVLLCADGVVGYVVGYAVDVCVSGVGCFGADGVGVDDVVGCADAWCL